MPERNSISLHVKNDQVIAQINDKVLARTPLSNLPDLDTVKSNPYACGQVLFCALGGENLLQYLNRDPEGVLLLSTDEKADVVPWEFAALNSRKSLLSMEYGLLRLVNRESPSPPPGTTLHFVVLSADPLVNEEGQIMRYPRLQQIDKEITTIQRVLVSSKKAIVARRIPPTARALNTAARRGPAWLHIAAHAKIIPRDHGPEIALLLEDEDGRKELLLGSDLAQIAPQGVIRLVVLSSCCTEAGHQARLARDLVHRGIPAAIGMQGLFPDNGGAVFAEALYDTLLCDHHLAEALRQARLSLLRECGVTTVGLPVAYVARNGWYPLHVPNGLPDTRQLFPLARMTIQREGIVPVHQTHLGIVDLPLELRPLKNIQGRWKEIHEIARLYSMGARVVTISGPTGIGKTSVAAAFAYRFAWRWQEGVVGFSFSTIEHLNAEFFRQEIIRRLRGKQEAEELSRMCPPNQEQTVLEALQEWDGLLIVDNYDTVLQALSINNEAKSIHCLLKKISETTRTKLLLTSQSPSSDFFGHKECPLNGIPEEEGAKLFLTYIHSGKSEGLVKLAYEVAREVKGNPLAIIQVAKEFNARKEISDQNLIEIAREVGRRLRN